MINATFLAALLSTVTIIELPTLPPTMSVKICDRTHSVGEQDPVFHPTQLPDYIALQYNPKKYCALPVNTLPSCQEITDVVFNRPLLAGVTPAEIAAFTYVCETLKPVNKARLLQKTIAGDTNIASILLQLSQNQRTHKDPILQIALEAKKAKQADNKGSRQEQNKRNRYLQK